MSPKKRVYPKIRYVFPNELPDDLRRQLFWVIKRHTSYTAWARAFAAFDAVIHKMESLLPELAAKPFGTYGIGLPPDTKPLTVWPHWEYTLNWHRNYRAALAHLREGDKEALGTKTPDYALSFQAELCKYNLVCFFRGEHPDPREGYYRELDPIIPEKAELTRLAELAYCLATENVILARNSVYRGFYCADCELQYSPDQHRLKIDLPHHPDKKPDALTRYPIPTDLPPVPGPVILPGRKTPLILNSDEMTALPGIYLSAPYGDIRYLLPNVPAPFLFLHERKSCVLPCTWTLIWRDDRYENGADIPEEEALYFPEESVDARPKGASARPGETCPLTGMWYALNMPGNHKFIKQGETMPGPENTSFGTVIWYWKQEDPYPGS